MRQIREDQLKYSAVIGKKCTFLIFLTEANFLEAILPP